MPDRKHAVLAKAFAAMHHAPDKAAIDEKADRILAKKRGGFITGKSSKPHLGRMGRAGGGVTAEPDLKAAYAAGQARRDAMSAEQRKAEDSAFVRKNEGPAPVDTKGDF
jgi:hypothetical protein